MPALLPVIYLTFVSLGLPDSALGAAWPSMYGELGAGVSWVGLVSAIICLGTIASSVASVSVVRWLGTGKTSAVSVVMTAAGLMGFSLCTEFWQLCLWAVPYGLGAGAIDAALNSYVAIHYASRHMSWLHCMWGVGASVGPYIMGYALSQGQGWPWGYRYIAILQVMLTVILVLSLPLWKKRGAIAVGESTDDTASSDGNAERFGTAEGVSVAERKPLGVAGVLAIRGAKEILVMFFCYCAVESTTGLWASSYMVMHSGIDKITAASWASLFYVGITVGRALSGFLTMRFKDPVMIRLGQVLVFAGILTMFVPLPHHLGVVVGLVVIGFGCAPIYPCVIHSTPAYFGEDKSQAIVGVQMACAYVGSLLMPPLFGIIAQYATISLYPWYLLVLLVLMVAMHERLRKLRG